MEALKIKAYQSSANFRKPMSYNFIDTYLYVVKFLDEEISNYLTESEEAINFYYIDGLANVHIFKTK